MTTNQEYTKEIRKTIRQMEKAYAKNPQGWILATIESLKGQLEVVENG